MGNQEIEAGYDYEKEDKMEGVEEHLGFRVSGFGFCVVVNEMVLGLMVLGFGFLVSGFALVVNQMFLVLMVSGFALSSITRNVVSIHKTRNPKPETRNP